MRIVVLVESLTFGGAERQACVLAGEFKRRGHDVCVATYHQDDFYLPLLERENVEHRFLGGCGKFSWALNVRRFLRTHGQDVVLAFLPGPSAYAELAGLPRRSWGLVVSERLANPRSRLDPKLWLHGLADYVVANSHANRLIIEERCAWLKPRLVTVYNALHIEDYHVIEGESERHEGIRLVVAARYAKQKNLPGLIRALADLKRSNAVDSVTVDWYGPQNGEAGVLEQARKESERHGLDDVLRLRGPTHEIHEAMSAADAVLLPSFFEGLPNAVCEGMALGKPILMSDVCDARNLVRHGLNGFLFDPHSPASIATAIAEFSGLSLEERNHMGRASRIRAVELFDADTVVNRYLRILWAAAARQSLKIEHWPEVVPDCSDVG